MRPVMRSLIVNAIGLLAVGLICWSLFGFFLVAVGWAAFVLLVLWVVRRIVDVLMPLQLTWPVE